MTILEEIRHLGNPTEGGFAKRMFKGSPELVVKSSKCSTASGRRELNIEGGKV